VKTVTPLDLRRSLGRILDEASAGERFLIARDHHPLAVLVSVEDAARLDEPQEALVARRRASFAALDDWRRRVGPDPSGGSAVEQLRRERDAMEPRVRGRLASEVDA
jgi:prevent-host-death family protein